MRFPITSRPFRYLVAKDLFCEITTSCRDARDGILLLPLDDELHVDDVHVRHEHGVRLSRDCRPHGVWLLPYDGELRARDVRQP